MNINKFDVDEILAEVEQKRINRRSASEKNGALSDFENSYQERKPVVSEGFGRDVYDWVSCLMVSLMAVILTLTFVVRVNEVEGQSMEPTLSQADRLLVWELGYSPSFGDIVVIQADNLPNGLTGEMGEGIVKRIIGLAGDTIDIDEETGVVYSNGEALDEPYIAETISRSRMGNAEYPLTVPENTVYVLGDNRNHSTDSRFMKDDYNSYYVGFVDVRNIIGKVIFRIYPFDRLGII